MENTRFSHEYDEQIPVTQYIVMRNDAGKDVYKRRLQVSKRVKKERDEEYFENKRRALSAREKRRSDKALEADDKRVE